MILPQTCRKSSQRPRGRPDAPSAIEVGPDSFGAESLLRSESDRRQFSQR
jgi:hypothetical protein